MSRIHSPSFLTICRPLSSSKSVSVDMLLRWIKVSMTIQVLLHCSLHSSEHLCMLPWLWQSERMHEPWFSGKDDVPITNGLTKASFAWPNDGHNISKITGMVNVQAGWCFKGATPKHEPQLHFNENGKDLRVTKMLMLWNNMIIAVQLKNAQENAIATLPLSTLVSALRKYHCGKIV